MSLTEAAVLSHKVQSSLSSSLPSKRKNKESHNYVNVISLVSIGMIIGYMVHRIHHILDEKEWSFSAFFSSQNNNNKKVLQSDRNLLLISNESKNAYQQIKECLDKENINKVLLIPFGHNDWQQHSKYVEQKMWEIGKECKVIMDIKRRRMKRLIKQCNAILIVGGNTYSLLHFLYYYNLICILQKVINDGTFYIGIGAGANITSITIQTCFDIPFIQPKTLKSLSVIPFQLVSQFDVLYNDIYEHQIRIFLEKNSMSLLGLCSNSVLMIKGNEIRLNGIEKTAAILYRNHLDLKEEIASNGLLSSIMFDSCK